MSTAATKAVYPPPQIQSAPGGAYPAGPSFLGALLSGRAFRPNPAETLAYNARQFGDLVHYRAAGRHIYQFNHPDLVQDLLVTDARHHHRGMVMQRSKLVLGEGLLTSEEPLHMRQRRLAAPAFHRDRIAGYGRVIGAFAAEMTAGWQPGICQVHTEMQRLALRIVGKTLFDEEMGGDTQKIAEAIEAFMAFLPLVFLPFSETIQKLPIPMMQRIRRSRVEVDALIDRIIAERRAPVGAGGSSPAVGLEALSGNAPEASPHTAAGNPPATPQQAFANDAHHAGHPASYKARPAIVDRGDLLSMLLAAEDTEENTGGMSDSQVRDECVTALLAGNETTANALSFALWLLATHPEAQQRLHDEACAVLGSPGTAGARDATAGDYASLRYAHMCFAETMRLYPPVWVTARTAAVTYQYRGFTIPEGAILLAPQIVVHHDERFWQEPERFDPLRFSEETRGGRPKLSYFPFAAGSRQCIGEGLAWMEGVLSLATMARDWRFSLPAGAAAKLEVQARVSLRPKGTVPLQVERW